AGGYAAGRSGKALQELMQTGYEAARPSGWDPVERLKDQELDGIDAEVLYPSLGMTLFAMSAGMLMFSLLLGRYLVSSKFGRILTAIRDAEMRVMFLGYNPLWYKLFIWVLAAIVCGMAGALYVPQVGIINPSEMATANSIEIAIWTSIGGRGTLVGPAIGAIVVNLSKSWFTVAFPEYWLYFLGLMFVLVTLLLPQGIVGLYQRLVARSTR
ncbi:MAG: hypothetical protein IH810_02135, partial [Proteobacteria bacterium]|nr:hypothetical protein [Pseudomonadota bacterium]